MATSKIMSENCHFALYNHVLSTCLLIELKPSRKICNNELSLLHDILPNFATFYFPTDGHCVLINSLT